LKKTAIIFGGNSYEHEISIVSAISISKVLDFELLFIFVDNKYNMYVIEQSKLKASLFLDEKYNAMPNVSFAKKGFLKQGFLRSTLIKCENAINLIHGQNGEDGLMTSLLKWFDFNYISPSMEASAISYNKILTKLYAKKQKVQTLNYQTTNTSKDIKSIINFPIIIKPSKLGSSIGINIASNQDELIYYIDEALEYDSEILLEPFMENIKEFNLAGYFDISSNEIKFSKIEEVKKDKFLDFDTKYLDFSRESIVNDNHINTELKEKIKKAFKNLYIPTFKGSIIRCDFFEYKNEIYINEINSIPGSMANYLFDDFNKIIESMLSKTKKDTLIKIDYKYINKIKKAK